jgi:hypothetical protein
MAGHIHRIF